MYRAKKVIKLSQLSVLVALFQLQSLFAGEPDCSSVGGWPTSMAFVHLKNAGLCDHKQIDLAKTDIKRLLSSEKAKGVYRQIYLIRFHKRSGENLEVITVSDAVDRECSGSDVDVYVISRHLGGKDK